MEERPSCGVIVTRMKMIDGVAVEVKETCGNSAHIMRYHKITKIPSYRKIRGFKDGESYYCCYTCHMARTPKLKYDDNIRRGSSYKNHKGQTCENKDGRLGYKCTTTIIDSCQLNVDHKDGDHQNNNPDNLQTLCSCCDAYKTKMFRDSGVSKKWVPKPIGSLEDFLT
jgi:hypothetical protein